ncbi:hypothetical protein F3N37_002112 [Escherichia coli]|nr:hypothetical protein [Escherichia coli]
MKNSKRITFNMFIKANGKLNITVMEGKASKQDKSFEVVSGKTLTEMRQNAGIKDGAEWQITNRFDKRHVKPTLVEGESVYCFARAVKADETYYLAVVKTASGFRAVMHHKSKRNEYGVETQEVAKRFRTVATESTVKDVSGTVNTAKGGSFYNHALQVTSSFFCKKEAQKEVPVVVEEVKEEVAVVESSEVEALKAELTAVKAENASLKEENASLKAELAAQETTFEAVVEVEAVEEKSIDEELEELLNYRWGNGEEVEQEEQKEADPVVVPVEVEEESAPVTNFESLRNNFMAKFKTTWEDTEEEQEEIEVNEDEIREAQMALHDAIYDTNYSAYAYAA